MNIATKDPCYSVVYQRSSKQTFNADFDLDNYF